MGSARETGLFFIINFLNSDLKTMKIKNKITIFGPERTLGNQINLLKNWESTENKGGSLRKREDKREDEWTERD